MMSMDLIDNITQLYKQGDNMDVNKIRKSILYEKALEYAKSGNNISETVKKLLENKHIHIQVNRGNGEWLVFMALIIEQAYKDVSPFIARRTEFKE